MSDELVTLKEWVAEYLYPGLDVGCGCCAADGVANIEFLTETLGAAGFTAPAVGHRRCNCGAYELRDQYARYEPSNWHYAGTYCRDEKTKERLK
jgi:hypothetical protein